MHLARAFGQPASTVRNDSANNAQTNKARSQPDSTRDAIFHSLYTAAFASGNRQQRNIEEARALAGSYATAWKDAFLIRLISRFEAASDANKRHWVTADSARRAGITAISTKGVPAAMALWKESLWHANASKERAAIAPALLSIGAGFYRASEFDSALAYVSRSEDMAQRIADFRTLGNAVALRASIENELGHPGEAIELYEKATSIRERSGDRRGIAADANNLGRIAEERGDVELAADSYKRALRINREDNRSILVALNLSNLGAIATRNGDYAAAESYYRESVSLYRASGSNAETAFALHGLGKLYMSRGDYEQAVGILSEALAAHTRSGATAEAIKVRVDLAEVENAMGNPEASKAILDQAVIAANSIEAPTSLRASLALARGDLAVQFGTFADADSEFSRAIGLYRAGADSVGLAQALEARAQLMQARGDYKVALVILNEAERIQLRMNEYRAAMLTGLSIANALWMAGDTSTGRRTLVSVQRSLHSIGDVAGEGAAFAQLGEFSLASGNAREAAVNYRRGLKALGRRGAFDVSWRLHAGLGEALERQGAISSAADELKTAIDLSEKRAANVRLENRSGFFGERVGPYAELARLEISRGRVDNAFELSERMRARQLLTLLIRGRVARRSEVSRQEQDLRKRIDMLTEQLQAGEPGDAVARDPALKAAIGTAVRANLDAAQKEYARILAKLGENDPRFAAVISAKTSSWRDVARKLKPNEAFVEYLVDNSTSTAFVVTTNSVRAVDLHITRQALSDLIQFSRRTIDDPRVQQRQLWRIPLRRLYKTLVTPVESAGLLSGIQTLFIAPHGDLHFLSFAALIAPGTQDRFLVERFQVAYAPSATVWTQSLGANSGSASSHVLALAPNVRRLPGSRREALAIKRIYGKNAQVRLGAAATPQVLRAMVPNVSIVHLATFGVLNKHNPLFSFVELAPSSGDDGRLEVNEVFGLPFAGQLVVLSACQTAVGSGALADVPSGDDWVGFVQAFFQAGAGSVMATLWPVQDRATGDLIEQFYSRLSTGMSATTAIAEAQRFMLRNPATSAPAYWAAFTLNEMAHSPPIQLRRE